MTDPLETQRHWQKQMAILNAARSSRARRRAAIVGIARVPDDDDDEPRKPTWDEYKLACDTAEQMRREYFGEDPPPTTPAQPTAPAAIQAHASPPAAPVARVAPVAPPAAQPQPEHSVKLSGYQLFEQELHRRAQIGNALYSGNFKLALDTERVYGALDRIQAEQKTKEELAEEQEKRRKDFVDAIAEAGTKIRKHNRP